MIMDESLHLSTLPRDLSETAEDASRRRILVIDNDPSTRRFLLTALDTAQNELASAKTPDEALDAVREQPPFNIIVCSLPQAATKDCTLIAKLRAGGERAPILAIASQWTLDTLARALESGADDWLQKPFDLNELRRSVSLLSSRALERLQAANRHVQYYDAQVTWSE